MLKSLFLNNFYILVKPIADRSSSDSFANIIMSYIDGELFTIINKRAFPCDLVEERIIKNSIQLVELYITNLKRDAALLDRIISTTNTI